MATKTIYLWNENLPKIYHYIIILPSVAVNIFKNEVVKIPFLFLLHLLRETDRSFIYYCGGNKKQLPLADRYLYKKNRRDVSSDSWTVHKRNPLYSHIKCFTTECEAKEYLNWYVNAKKDEVSEYLKQLEQVANEPVFRSIL